MPKSKRKIGRGKRKHNHFRVTVTYTDNEVSGRVYNNREKAEKFAARQKRSPFVNNLPEKHRSRWGEGLTADDMKKCVWVRPELVAQIEFLEWTESDRAASDYTRSSNTTREVSDHASLSSALGPRV